MKEIPYYYVPAQRWYGDLQSLYKITSCLIAYDDAIIGSLYIYSYYTPSSMTDGNGLRPVLIFDWFFGVSLLLLKYFKYLSFARFWTDNIVLWISAIIILKSDLSSKEVTDASNFYFFLLRLLKMRIRRKPWKKREVIKKIFLLHFCLFHSSDSELAGNFSLAWKGPLLKNSSASPL